MKPILCLNMIVKNESKIICRLFDSVISIIDCYCICDTGSSDDTIQVIQNYFQKKNISGKIFTEPFINFSYNRNISIQECRGMSDYILLLDADMIVKFDENDINYLKKYIYNFDLIYVLQGSYNFYYQNIRIIKNTQNINNYKYIGATHEYLDFSPINENKITTFDKNLFFIDDIGDGSNKKNKFQRDVELLINGIKEEPNNARYYFYLANSYYDLGNYNEAINIYIKRIELNGWKEEVWNSYYKLGLCYKNINDYPKAINSWLEGFEYHPERLEGLYEIINYYRVNGKNKLALQFYNIAKNILKNIDENKKNEYLFLHDDVYSYKLFYEFTIIAFYNKICNINDEIIQVLNNSNDNLINNNLLSNIKFYNNCLIHQNLLIFDEIFIYDDIIFYSSSSCLININNTNNYLMNVRYVNYSIDKTGKYINNEQNIISLNKCFLLDEKFNILNTYIFNIDIKNNDNLYIGIEDIKIYNSNQKLLFIGTEFNKNKNNLGISYGEYNYLNNKIISHQLILNNNNKLNICEKNWIFTKYKNKTHVIYKWFPLTICEFNCDEINIIEEKKMPLFFSNIRGSTCGFNHEVNQELWFITHLVSHEIPRHYYHCIIVLDYNLNLLRYSAPFKFENEAIEYCLSILVNNNQLIINYSTWDKTTRIGFYEKEYIETLLIY